MSALLLRTLERHLATSDSAARKAWAQEIVDDDIPLTRLFSLFDPGNRTSQRFMWLIGDVCEIDPDRVAECLPLLFSLRNEMPFPGMPRSVAKWLLLTGVPSPPGKQAIDQLLRWVRDENSSVACKSYSAKALERLTRENRMTARKATAALSTQINHPNRAYASRIRKLLNTLEDV